MLRSYLKQFFKKRPLGIIFDQVVTDLSGKDAFRGNSQSYAWLANQLGHFSLGFFGMMFINALLQIFNKYVYDTYNTDGKPLTFSNPQIEDTYLTSSVISAILVFAFEYNLLRKLKSNIVKFKDLDPGFIYWDWIIDLTYFVLGIAQAFVVLKGDFYKCDPWQTSIINIGVIVMVFILTSFEYYNRIRIDEAKFPFYFSIFKKYDNSKGDSKSDDSESSILEEINKVVHLTQRILEPINSEDLDKPSEFYIFGKKGVGKSYTAVGLATYLIYQGINCRYFTFNKLDLNNTIDSNEKDKKTPEILVIDDLPLSDHDTCSENIHSLEWAQKPKCVIYVIECNEKTRDEGVQDSFIELKIADNKGLHIKKLLTSSTLYARSAPSMLKMFIGYYFRSKKQSSDLYS